MQRLGEDPEALLLVSWRRRSIASRWGYSVSAVLVQRRRSRQSAFQMIGRPLSRAMIAAVSSGAGDLRRAAADRAQRPGEGDHLVLGHVVGDHRRAVEVELHVADLAEDLRAPAAAAGLHRLDEQLAHLSSSSSVTRWAFALSTPTT